MGLADFVKQHLTGLSQRLINNVRDWTKPHLPRLLVGTATDFTRSKHDLMVENALLRHQLMVLERQVKRPKLRWRDRAVMVVLSSRLASWKDALVVARNSIPLGRSKSGHTIIVVEHAAKHVTSLHLTSD